jgi:hypothetical protein
MRRSHTGKAVVFLLLFLLVGAATPAFPQSKELFTTRDLKVTYGGYVKNLTTLTTYDNGERWDDLLTLRIKTEATFRDVAKLTLHYEISSLIGESLRVPAFRQSSLYDPDEFANLYWGIADGDEYLVTHTLDRAYLTVYLNDLTLIVGRQRIAWGVARFISPLDQFNPFDPAAIDKEEKRGTDAVTAEIALNDVSGLSLVFAPTTDMDEASWAFRAYTNVSNYDFAVMAGRFKNREVFGFDFSGQVGSIAVWGECAAFMEDNRRFYFVEDPSSFFGFSEREAPREYLRAALGAQYIFPNTFSILVEYYYNGRGEFSKDNYDWLAQADGSELSLAQDYFFADLSYEITPLLTADLSTFYNVDDGSVMFAPSLEYSITEDLYVTVGAQIGAGEHMTEYEERPDLYYLQVRYYF